MLVFTTLVRLVRVVAGGDDFVAVRDSACVLVVHVALHCGLQQQSFNVHFYVLS